MDRSIVFCFVFLEARFFCSFVAQAYCVFIWNGFSRTIQLHAHMLQTLQCKGHNSCGLHKACTKVLASSVPVHNRHNRIKYIKIKSNTKSSSPPPPPLAPRKTHDNNIYAEISKGPGIVYWKDSHEGWGVPLVPLCSFTLDHFSFVCCMISYSVSHPR